MRMLKNKAGHICAGTAHAEAMDPPGHSPARGTCLNGEHLG